jgi:hypothetical protein
MMYEYRVHAISNDGVTHRYVGATQYDDLGKRLRQFKCQRTRSQPVGLTERIHASWVMPNEDLRVSS